MIINKPQSEYEREAMIISSEAPHERSGIMRFARIKRELLNSIKKENVMKVSISSFDEILVFPKTSISRE